MKENISDHNNTSPTNQGTTILQHSVIVVIVIATAIFDLYCATGFYGATDDTEYFIGMYSLLFGEPTPIPHKFQLGGYRLGVTVPMAIGHLLSGGDLFTIARVFIFFHCGLVLLTYLSALYFGGIRSGIISSLIVAGSPLGYLFAGSPLPDLALTFWTLASWYIFVRLFKDKLTPKRLYLSLLTTGILIGVAYTAKESALLLTIPCSIGILFLPKISFSSKTLGGIALVLGLGIAIGGEMITLKSLGRDDSLFRASELSDYTGTYLYRLEKDGAHPTERFSLAWKKLANSHNVIKATGIAFILYHFLFLFPKKPGRETGFLIFTLLFVTTYLTVGTTSLSTYAPPTIQDRYYTLVLPYAAILISYVTTRYLPFFLLQLIIPLAVIVLDSEVGLKVKNEIYGKRFLDALTEAIDTKRELFPEETLYLTKNQTKLLIPYLTRGRENIVLVSSPIPGHTSKPSTFPESYLMIAGNLDNAEDVSRRLILSRHDPDKRFCEISTEIAQTITSKKPKVILARVQINSEKCNPPEKNDSEEKGEE